jgi:hypothetical protein
MDDLIRVEAILKIKSVQEGGPTSRRTTGYRPNHVFEYVNNNIVAYIGTIIMDDPNGIEPGEEKMVTVQFLDMGEIRKYMQEGRKWWIHEGADQIGKAQIIKVISEIPKSKLD